MALLRTSTYYPYPLESPLPLLPAVADTSHLGFVSYNNDIDWMLTALLIGIPIALPLLLL
jgi:hypothetical protein